MRFARCLISAFNPRLRHSIAVKKPLTRKNKGMRKPCTARKKSPNSLLVCESCTTHGTSEKESATCNAIPSSIAIARNASRSCRRATPVDGTGDVSETVIAELSAKKSSWMTEAFPDKQIGRGNPPVGSSQRRHIVRTLAAMDSCLHVSNSITLGVVRFGIVCPGRGGVACQDRKDVRMYLSTGLTVAGAGAVVRSWSASGSRGC